MPTRRRVRRGHGPLPLLSRSGHAGLRALGTLQTDFAPARTRARSRATAFGSAPPKRHRMESVLSHSRELSPWSPRDKSDVAALRELIAEHRPYVRASLRHLGVGADQLDDAEQDVFLVVVRREDDFDPKRGTSYRGWIWGMCRNVAATHRRKRRKALRHDTTVELGVRPLFEERVAARQALASLDEPSRAVWLGRCEGRSARELADALALPVTTVEWRLRQARHAVRKALRGLGRHASAWVGWLLRPEQGLASLAIPALAVLVLVPSSSDEPPAPAALALLHAKPEPHLAGATPSTAPRASARARPQPVVAHVEEHEPLVRTNEPPPRLRRRRTSGRVVLGDPSVDHP